MLPPIILAMAIAATPVAAPNPVATFTPEQKQQVMEAIKVINENFGKAPAPQVQQAAPEKKSMADVADKALDISTKYIAQIVGVIEQVAPHVWRVMVKQQYAKAIGGTIEPLIWLLMMPLVSFTIRYFWKIRKDPDVTIIEGDKKTVRAHDCTRDRCATCTSENEHAWRVVATLVFPGAIAVIAAGVLASRLAACSMYIISPEYYAIRDLVQILLHPGSL